MSVTSGWLFSGSIFSGSLFGMIPNLPTFSHRKGSGAITTAPDRVAISSQTRPDRAPLMEKLLNPGSLT